MKQPRRPSAFALRKDWCLVRQFPSDRQQGGYQCLDQERTPLKHDCIFFLENVNFKKWLIPLRVFESKMKTVWLTFQRRTFRQRECCLSGCNWWSRLAAKHKRKSRQSWHALALKSFDRGWPKWAMIPNFRNAKIPPFRKRQPNGPYVQITQFQ